MRIQAWNVVYLVGFVVYVWIRGKFSSRVRTQKKSVTRVDTVEYVLMGMVLVGSMLLPIVYLFTPWLQWADYRLPTWAPWCGAALMPLALWLFWRSHSDLGLNWSMTLELREGHELVTTGVYRRIRHPMYAAIWLFSLAQALLLENWLAGWSALVTFAPLYLVRTPREERFMCEFFGHGYHDYMQKTGRLLPWTLHEES